MNNNNCFKSATDDTGWPNAKLYTKNRLGSLLIIESTSKNPE